jgi:tellurite resistance protein TerC
MDHSIWLWAGFGAFILLMLGIDLGLFNRTAHRVSYKEAAVWSGIWVSLAVAFAGFVFYQFGSQRGLEFVTGYLIELSLSVDNLFVFILIFAYFKLPQRYQHRVLFWGVMGALVMRITMILVGAELIERFQWINYIFGAFLIYTGIKMLREEQTEIEPESNLLVKLATRFVPMTREYDDHRFFTKVSGKTSGTLLMLVLVIVEVTDLIFAVDSIPAIFAVTGDRFILYTSNVFAILGLRSLFFLLAGVIDKFHYLRYGLSIVLAFIGVKMLIVILGVHINIAISLGVVALVLLGSVLLSVVMPEGADKSTPSAGTLKSTTEQLTGTRADHRSAKARSRPPQHS